MPIWMGYMGAVLKGVPEDTFEPPPGVVTAKVDAYTGLRVPDTAEGINDFFYQEFLPPLEGAAPAQPGTERPAEEVRNQLF